MRLPKGIDPGDLAREHQIFFVEVLDLWVQDEFGDARSPLQVRYGIPLRLLALGNVDERDRQMKELRRTPRQLHAAEEVQRWADHAGTSRQRLPAPRRQARHQLEQTDRAVVRSFGARHRR